MPTSGLSLRTEGLGFPLATTNVGASYFHRKIEPKENPGCLIPFLIVVFTQQLEFLVTALAHLLSNNIWSFFKKITTGVGQRPKLEQLRPNKSGELEIMPTHVL